VPPCASDGDSGHTELEGHKCGGESPGEGENFNFANFSRRLSGIGHSHMGPLINFFNWK
jgi:hypothetical protein